MTSTSLLLGKATDFLPTTQVQKFSEHGRKLISKTPLLSSISQRLQLFRVVPKADRAHLEVENVYWFPQVEGPDNELQNEMEIDLIVRALTS